MRKGFIVMLSLAVLGMLSISTAYGQYQPTSEKGIAQLEADWLFQCDNEPTFDKAKAEIGYARQVAERLAKLEGAPDLTAQLAALDELEKKVDAKDGTEKDLYLAVRRAKREIVMRNPLINFSEILLIDNPYPKGKEGDATEEFF